MRLSHVKTESSALVLNYKILYTIMRSVDIPILREYPYKIHSIYCIVYGITIKQASYQKISNLQ